MTRIGGNKSKVLHSELKCVWLIFNLFHCKDSGKATPEQIFFCLVDYIQIMIIIPFTKCPQRIYQMFILLLQIGKGLYNPGAPSHAELVTREMYCSNPDRFCWIAPDTCSKGMTLAFWIQYKGSDAEWSCIITSAHFPSNINTGVQANAFGIYFVRQVPTKLFVYLTGNVTNGRNYYQTFVQVN